MGKRYGGRQKGTPNRDSIRPWQIALAHKFEPIELLIHFARGDEKALGWGEPLKIEKGGVVFIKDRITPEMRLNAVMEACSYLYPKRKAIEHTGPDGGPIEHKSVDMTDLLKDPEAVMLMKRLQSKVNGSSSTQE